MIMIGKRSASTFAINEASGLYIQQESDFDQYTYYYFGCHTGNESEMDGEQTFIGETPPLSSPEQRIAVIQQRHVRMHAP